MRARETPRAAQDCDRILYRRRSEHGALRVGGDEAEALETAEGGADVHVDAHAELVVQEAFERRLRMVS